LLRAARNALTFLSLSLSLSRTLSDGILSAPGRSLSFFRRGAIARLDISQARGRYQDKRKVAAGEREGELLYSRGGQTDGRTAQLRFRSAIIRRRAETRRRRRRQVAQKRITNRGERVCVTGRRGRARRGITIVFLRTRILLSRDVPLAVRAAKANL